MTTSGTERSPRAYDGVAKALHWSVALLVIALLVIGKYMTDWLTGLTPERFWYYQLHKSLGFTVLALMALRIGWRLTHRPPPLVDGMAVWERLAAHGAHLALYGLLLILPLSGWLVVSTSPLPIPTLFFGLFPIPHIGIIESLPPDAKATVHGLANRVHWLAGTLLIVIVLAHVAAALRHHFLKKDDTLTRMLPGRRSDRSLSGWLLAFGAALILALPAASPTRAEAPAWIVDKTLSRIGFEASAGGQLVTGTIGTFDVALAFDPETLAGTAVTVTMDVASLSTGNGQIDEALGTADWFDKSTHPTARYVATAATKTSDGAYELQGELTLKGVTKPVPIPFTLAIDSGVATATGTMIIDRSAFGIGRGQAADAVAPEVKVLLTLAAKRQ